MFGVISATYTDKGGQGANSAAPPLSTTNQVQIRQKHQEVENVVIQSGTTDGEHDREYGSPVTYRGSLAAGDWIQLNGAHNLYQIDTLSFRVSDATPAGNPVPPRRARSVRRWRRSSCVRARRRRP